MHAPDRILCAACAALVSDSDPDARVEITRLSFDPPRLLDVSADERWKFVQLLAADTSEAHHYAVSVHGFELPMLAASKLHGSWLCARHLAPYAALSAAEEARR